MARPNRIREIAEELEQKPDQMVLEALIKHGTIVAAAEAIGVSFQSLWDYAHNRFEKVCYWRRVNYINGSFATVIRIDPITDESGEKQ